jgi:hypothetical protein
MKSSCHIHALPHIRLQITDGRYLKTNPDDGNGFRLISFTDTNDFTGASLYTLDGSFILNDAGRPWVSFFDESSSEVATLPGAETSQLSCRFMTTERKSSNALTLLAI